MLAHAEIHPILFKDTPELYAKVYFGMGYEDFRSKLGSNIFECKEAPNKAIADQACKTSFRLGNSGISEAIGLFKNNILIAILGRINSDSYAEVNSNLSNTFRDQPQIADREEKKGIFSKKISNQYSTWSYPDYLMMVSKFDVQKYVDSGTNFSLFIETSNTSFITQIRSESKKRSNLEFPSRISIVDLANLHIANGAPIATADKNTPKATDKNQYLSQVEAEKNKTNLTGATDVTKTDVAAPVSKSGEQLGKETSASVASSPQSFGVLPDAPSKSGSANGGGLGKALSNLFGGKGAKLKSFIEANDTDGALAFYESEKEYFTENQSGNLDSLKALADKLNEKYSPAILSVKSKLEAYNLDEVKPTQWSTIKSDLQESDRRIAEYNAMDIIGKVDARSNVLLDLLSLTDRLKKQLASKAQDNFLNYDWLSSPSFFESYPINLDSAKVLGTKSQEIGSKVCSFDSEKISNFAKTYHSYLPDDLAGTVSSCFIQAVIKEGERVGKGGLTSALLAIQKAKDAGLSVTKPTEWKIGFVQVTSKTLINEGAIEFPAEVSVDLPFDVSKAEIDDAFNNNSDYLIVFDVAKASTQRRIQKREELESKIQTRIDRVPNPEYETARMKVYEAQSGLNQAQSQYAYGAAAQIVKAISIGVWSGNVKKAQEAFSSTQSYQEVPAYEPYKYSVSDVDVNKVMTVNYYVINKKNNTYYKGAFDVSENRAFRIAYNINDKDPDKSRLISRFSKEDEIAKFEKDGLSVKLSALVENYTKNQGASIPLGSIQSLRNEMLADKNRALADYKSNKYDARPLNDPRFDNVVVILNPKGQLGTGFYVRPDLVLTNYHVIEGVKYAELKLYNGMETFGKVVKSDVRLDLALIKVETRGKPVDFYTGNTIDLGATVEAIGHPKGLQFTITRGVVSALRKKQSIFQTGGKEVLFIQTDAAINPGNSGGPLFLGEKVIGVNDNKMVQGGVEGLGFAIHYSEVAEFMKEGF